MENELEDMHAYVAKLNGYENLMKWALELFNCVDDVNPRYLKKKDYIEAKKISKCLGIRVTNRIEHKTK